MRSGISALIESKSRGFKKLVAISWILCIAIYILDMCVGYIPGMNILKVLVFAQASILSALIQYALKAFTSNEEDFYQLNEEEDYEPQYQNSLLRILFVAIALGSSVLLVGALFKIMHWPSANMLLNVGAFTCGAQFAGLFIFIRDEFERKSLMKWSLACMLMSVFFYGINYQNLHSQIKYREYPTLAEAYKNLGKSQTTENYGKLYYETTIYLIESNRYRLKSEESLQIFKETYQEFLKNSTEENLYKLEMQDPLLYID